MKKKSLLVMVLLTLINAGACAGGPEWTGSAPQGDGGRTPGWGGDDYCLLLSKADASSDRDKEKSKPGGDLVAKISLPWDNSLVRGDVPIFGLACGGDFKEYRLEYGKGECPAEWHTIHVSDVPCEEDITDEQLALLHKRPFGNLATWDTGLKNFPTWNHPPGHPVDLNGVYTIRLRVMGRNGGVAEDTKTVEIGRVVTMSYGGMAVSADDKVRLRIPEHGLISTHFRIIAIKPVEEVEIELPPGYILRGKLYEFRPAGEIFTKDALLEMDYGSQEAGPVNEGMIGIYAYNRKSKSWELIPRRIDAEAKTVTAGLRGFHETGAYFAVLEKTGMSEPLQLYPFSAGEGGGEPLLKDSTRIAGEDLRYLSRDTFGGSFGEWEERDYPVGASLSLDNEATPDGTYCLKLANGYPGGSFASTVRSTPFDAGEYSKAEFDYKVPEGVKINFLVKSGGRWYEIGFTDDANKYSYKYANITNIGNIKDVVADGRWRTAGFDLYDMMKVKTGHTVVDEMIMADYDIGENFVLTHGNNQTGAVYFIDNFRIGRNPDRDALYAESLPIDDFDEKLPVNLLGNKPFTFYSDDGSSCDKVLADDPQDGDACLRLDYEISGRDGYAGYVTFFDCMDLSAFQEISFQIRGDGNPGGGYLQVEDTAGNESAAVEISRYLPSGITGSWQRASLPLGAFGGTCDLERARSLSILFKGALRRSAGTVYIDDIKLNRRLSEVTVHDFESWTGKNLLGGDAFTFSSSVCEAASDYGAWYAYNSGGGCRIRYGGRIGIPHVRCTSFAAWSTELNGIDVRGMSHLSFLVKGIAGGEFPNIYLKDASTNSICVDIERYTPITTSWQEARIPLEDFREQGLDTSRLSELSFIFQEKCDPGALFIDMIRFE